MLIKRRDLERIVAGEVSLAFRRWRKPAAKTGGTQTTGLGVLAIDVVQAVPEEAITEADARRAGYADRDELLHALRRGSGDVYRIELHLAGADPRLALRIEVPEADELRSLADRLARMDRTSPDGPWTRAALEVIQRRPAVRAGDLAEELRMERERFKRNVRKLKNLGLTESLEVGYRLAPRGVAVLEHLTA